MEILEEYIVKAESAFYQRKWKQTIKLWANIIENYPETSFLIGDAKLQISVAKRIIGIKKYKKEILNYRKKIDKKNSTTTKYPKIAIYTVITNDYDSLKLPEVIDSRFEYFVFTDKPISGAGVWQVKPILSYFVDPARTSRFIKLHPHQLLKNFDIAIYIDSNLMLLGNISNLLEKFIKSKMPIGGIKHPYRKSLYEELDACILLDKDNKEIMREQISRYKKEGFQDENLVEANFLMFDLKNSQTQLFLNYWWQEIENGSRRDQLSFNYALKKSGLKFCSLMDEGYTTRNSPLIAWVHHDFGKGPAQKLIDEMNLPIEDPFSNESYTSIKENNLQRNKVSIDVIVYIDKNTKKYRECLNSITASRNNSKYKLLILDNSSSSDINKYLTKLRENKSWIEILHFNKSKRIPYIDILNNGLKNTVSEFVILVDANMLVSDSWAEKLADALLSTHGAGLVSPMTNNSNYISYDKSNKDTLIANSKALDAKYQNSTLIDILPQVAVVNRSCLGISRKVINDIGYFDSKNFTDKFCFLIDYCFRAADKGFISLIATHTYVAQLEFVKEVTQKSINQSLVKLKKKYPAFRIDRSYQAITSHPLINQLRRYVENKIDIDPSFDQVKK